MLNKFLLKFNMKSLKISSELIIFVFWGCSLAPKSKVPKSNLKSFTGEFNHIKDFTKRIRSITITKTTRAKFYTAFHLLVYKLPPLSLVLTKNYTHFKA